MSKMNLRFSPYQILSTVFADAHMKEDDFELETYNANILFNLF